MSDDKFMVYRIHLLSRGQRAFLAPSPLPDTANGLVNNVDLCSIRNQIIPVLHCGMASKFLKWQVGKYFRIVQSLVGGIMNN
jgi:hypothetical protein